MRFSSLLLAGCLALSSITVSAVEFSMKDMKGQTHRLTDYRGKWVLVNFWATWCPPCQQETPELVALHNAHKDKDLVVLGMALDSSKKDVEKFIVKYQVSYPMAVGDYKMAAQLGDIEALPSTFLIDPKGKLVGFQEGMITREAIESFLLKGEKPAKK
jgi:peroxiredoxin